MLISGVYSIKKIMTIKAERNKNELKHTKSSERLGAVIINLWVDHITVKHDNILFPF